MPHISTMLPSKFISKHDLPEAKHWTIKTIHENTFNDGSKKWVISFHECGKEMVLNKTNLKALVKICGSENSDDWIGKQICVYFDENVSFKGDLVGGVRFRATGKPVQMPSALRDSTPNVNPPDPNREDVIF